MKVIVYELEDGSVAICYSALNVMADGSVHAGTKRSVTERPAITGKVRKQRMEQREVAVRIPEVNGDGTVRLVTNTGMREFPVFEAKDLVDDDGNPVTRAHTRLEDVKDNDGNVVRARDGSPVRRRVTIVEHLKVAVPVYDEIDGVIEPEVTRDETDEEFNNRVVAEDLPVILQVDPPASSPHFRHPATRRIKAGDHMKRRLADQLGLPYTPVPHIIIDNSELPSIAERNRWRLRDGKVVVI